MSPELAAKLEHLKSDLWFTIMRNHEALFWDREPPKYDESFAPKKEKSA